MRDDALTGRVGVVVDNPRRWVYEVVIWAQMEMKGFAKGRERQSEGVSVVKGGGIWRYASGIMRRRRMLRSGVNLNGQGSRVMYTFQRTMRTRG